MTRQLRAVNLYIDDKNLYKSDGLIKLFEINNVELLLLETSGTFKNKDANKLKLDHHKGLYGSLAMLKSVADDFPRASLSSFCKVKVFFLHAADTELHFWSVSYRDEDMFDLWREANLKIMPDFEDRDKYLPDLVQFCWEIKNALIESVKNILTLKTEHKNEVDKHRYSRHNFDHHLGEIVNPLILK